MWELVRRKWRRHKRKKRFRAKRAVRRAQKEKTYLMLDQYTRGKVERQIVDFDIKIKAGKEKKPKKGKRGRWTSTLAFEEYLHTLLLTTVKEESSYDLEEGESSSESSTDTTDIDEVCVCSFETSFYAVISNTTCRLETLTSCSTLATLCTLTMPASL